MNDLNKAGLPVLLIPGLLCDDAVWTAQRAALLARPGSGPVVVAAHGSADSITQMAQQAIGAMPAGPFAVAGHSMGGRVALEIFRLVPQRVARLALMDTGWQGLAPGEAGEREKQDRFVLLALARERGMRAMAERWAVGMVHPDARHTQVFADVLDMIGRSNPDVYAAQINALLNRRDATPELAAIACPTLVLCGREDRWAPLARHEDMQAQIAGATLAVIDNSGHMVTMERPAETSAALLEWLAPSGLPCEL